MHDNLTDAEKLLEAILQGITSLLVIIMRSKNVGWQEEVPVELALCTLPLVSSPLMYECGAYGSIRRPAVSAAPTAIKVSLSRHARKGIWIFMSAHAVCLFQASV